MVGNFASFFVVCLFFISKIKFQIKFLEEYHHIVEQIGCRSGLTFRKSSLIWAQLDCLQMLSAHKKTRLITQFISMQYSNAARVVSDTCNLIFREDSVYNLLQ